jgi:hypothetical protein
MALPEEVMPMLAFDTNLAGCPWLVAIIAEDQRTAATPILDAGNRAKIFDVQRGWHGPTPSMRQFSVNGLERPLHADFAGGAFSV